jgi:glucarate dehydratase
VIESIGARVVSVPLEVPTRWALGVHTEATRVVYELRTREGVVGWGESYFVPDAARLAALASGALAGLDPLATGALHARLDAFEGEYRTMMPAGLRAGIEIAALDAAGKAIGVPVSTLLGGAVRESVAVAAYVFPRGEATSPEALVERSEELAGRYGFEVFKVKGGVGSPADDLRTLRLLAERFPGARLRLDPNAAWTVGDALALLGRIAAEELPVEYVEDPVAGLPAMASVRSRSVVALATNMCVVAFEHLAPAVEVGAVDIVLADPHYWGGFRANQRLIAVCDAFGLGVGMHSDNDLGISTAAKVHLAAASPSLVYAIDSHHAEHVDDLVLEPVRIAGGLAEVPTGPGLGVEPDPDALARYAVA